MCDYESAAGFDYFLIVLIPCMFADVAISADGAMPSNARQEA